MNIYVGNLPFSMTEEELESSFAAHGEVQSARIITDRFTGQSRVFGFVEMVLFIIILGVGLLYVWKRGGLDWE